MKKLDNKELLELYKSTIDEEHFYLEAHQKRANFFTGIISTLIGVSIFGLIQLSVDTNSVWYHFIILLFVPLLIVIISEIGKKGTFRFYQRFIETVTVRAKIEHELGFTNNRLVTPKSKDWWKFEQIIPPRHLEKRSDYNSSEEFVKDKKHSGYQGVIEKMFDTFIILGCFLISFCIIIATLKFILLFCPR